MPEAQTSRFRLDEVLAPVGDRRARDLPSLIRAASRLVWEAAPRQSLPTSGLQLVISAGFAAQLLVSRGLLTHLLAGRQHGYGSTTPYVAVLAIIIAIVGMAASARAEIQRLLQSSSDATRWAASSRPRTRWICWPSKSRSSTIASSALW